MTGLEIVFTGLAVLAFAATAWIVGVVAWRILRSPRR